MLLNINKIQKQLTWLTEQIKCLKSQACVCDFEETSVQFNPETGVLTIIFVDGSVRNVTIDIGTNVTNTSDLTNDGENGTDPFITLEDLPPLALVPERTSDLINDGEDGVNPFITLLDIPYQIIKLPTVADFPIEGDPTKVYLAEDTGIFYLWNGVDGVYEQITSNAFPTGLERITEAGNTGWRLIGRNPSNYGDIGMSATDISTSTTVSTTRGANGQYSFAQGLNTRASGTSAVALGTGTQATAQYSFAHGTGGQATNNSAEAGGNSTIASGNSSVAKGMSNRARSLGEVSLGQWGTDYTPVNASTATNTTDRVFNLGNGLSDIARSDAFTVFKNGAIRIFRSTLGLITNATSGFLIANTDKANRLSYHDGVAWQGLQYVREVKTVPGTTYTLVEEDKDKILHFTSSTDVTVTIPTGLTSSNRYEGKQLGDGQILFGTDLGVTLRFGASEVAKTAEKYSVFGLDVIGVEEYMLFGKLELS